VIYLRGGPGEPPRPLQRRFVEDGVEQALAHTDALTSALQADPLATVGVAPHSVRAVAARDLAIASEWARARQQPLHIHVAEQPAEVQACLSETGRRPVDLLFEVGALGDHVTAVHATHLTLGEIGRLGGSGTRVCVCPTTEADLGDGILHAGDLVAAGVRLCLGSDSQAMIDPFAEMRALEHHERLRTRRRNALVQPPFGLEVAPLLLAAAAGGGAGALGIGAGAISPGAPADLVAVDLGHPALAGADAASLAAMVALHGSAGLVTDVWVQGRQVVGDRAHPLAAAAREAFLAVMRALERPGSAGTMSPRTR
jgi:formimidoylglutamate deiminase